MSSKKIPSAPRLSFELENLLPKNESWKIQPRTSSDVNHRNTENSNEVSLSRRIQSILSQGNDNHEFHPLFTEMEELVKDGDKLEWNETARWIKFEENVEEGGDRWSKPHVATISLHSIFELRSLLTNGSVLLDLNAGNFEEIAQSVSDHLVDAGSMPNSAREIFRDTLLLRHRHQHEQKSRRDSIKKSKGLSRNLCNDSYKGNKHFMKKITPGTEANNILVGEVDFLDKTVSAFIRLKTPSIMGDLTEVPVPTRFLFILLVPIGSHSSFQQIGRAMATIMADEIFHEVAYRANESDHLLAGVDEFLDAVTVLPPGEWDPSIRIEPPATIPSQHLRKHPDKPIDEDTNLEEEEALSRQESGLARTGKLFGSLKNDLLRKAPWYWSDFKDVLSTQCIASWIFLYFACLAPIITFGGLIGAATGNNMAAMECILSGFICGIIYGFFSGQPLTILAATGPVLIFEAIVFQFCEAVELDYMSFRFWIGTWVAIILFIMVAVDASAYVCYITRFTEENFATLVAIIFIYQAFENVLLIGTKNPIASSGTNNCTCISRNGENDTDWSDYSKSECLNLNGTLVGADCENPEPVANVYLMSLILFFGTFATSIILKNFKNALYFPSKVRQFLSDFAVIIAILSMTILDYHTNILTPKLVVPSDFKPTLSTRGWLISPFANHFWWWLIAFFPALLGVILIFLDQQITAVIVNRKENKLKKGCGYHLDLFILAILIQICSTFGLPWFVAATVMSLNHVNSLKLETECAAPGEKPQFLGVREQRVTHVLIFLTIGCSVFLTPLLGHIPMPVLFGVFLYMGVDSLKGLQLFERILLLFMPVKYQPDHMYLRQVPLKRVLLFTLIQFACLLALWLIKSFSYTSILFPIMLVVIIGVRKVLDNFFTQRELRILDDAWPDMSKRVVRNTNDLEEGGEADQPPPYPGNLDIARANSNLTIPSKPINISEEVNKTTIWKQLNGTRRDDNTDQASAQNSKLQSQV